MASTAQLLTIIFCTASCFASDTISSDSVISGSQTIVSKGGNFELGFFHLGNNSSETHYYIGIWYKKVSVCTPVWVANRDAPVSDPASSQLKIAADGNLVLINGGNIEIWSTNVTSISSNTIMAVILDSGNFVLRNQDRFLWQSMDHPTDTWLPGARIGRNKVTGEAQTLTSWRNSGDPAPGVFSLGIDSNGSSQYFIYWNRTVTYWSSGEWNGRIFDGIPEMTAHYIFNFEFVSNANVSYFTYSLQDSMVISRLVMDVSGQIQQLTWVPAASQWMLFWTEPHLLCDVHAVCGAFGVCDEKSETFCSCLAGFHETSVRDWELGDHTQGCRRNTPLQCASMKSTANGREDDVFLPMPDMALLKDPVFIQVPGSEECRLACSRNCHCTAYSYGNACALWQGDLLNLQRQVDGASKANDLYLHLAASEQIHSRNSKRSITLASTGSVAFILALSTVMFFLVWMFRRRQSKRFMEASQGSNLVLFKYRDLQKVTKNLSEKIGGGSFGSVYKGTLPGSSAVAVKKLEGALCLGDKQFMNEVRTIGTIHHVNLVRLRGFCSRGSDRLLVYEYMPNGSLDKLLFEGNSTLLSWNVRYRIALGMARGLLYLHEGCRDCILHCDIKPENILLDEALVPKVADFGLAKLMGRDFSRVLTTVRGTIGYLAPEWISGLPITPKADVYSYGMVLLEIISGRRNTQCPGEVKQGGYYFPIVAARKVCEGEVMSLLDERLKGDADVPELERACRAACWCIQDDEANRPSMAQVAQMLEGVTVVNVPPIPLSLQTLAENAGCVSYFSGDFSRRSS